MEHDDEHDGAHVDEAGHEPGSEPGSEPGDTHDGDTGDRDAPPGPDVLVVDLVGEVHELEPPDTLTFGRDADLVVDANPFMHRVVGRFAHRYGVWWLQNLGSGIRLELLDPTATAPVPVVVGPGASGVLTLRRTTVRFEAGAARYELECGLATTVGPPRAAVPVAASTETRAFGRVPLSAEQHRLLVALVDSARRHRGRVEPSPTVARRLGWTTKKYHRKLDMVCDKLSRAGVRGLKGEVGSSADRRRDLLAVHAVAAGLVDERDLGAL